MAMKITQANNSMSPIILVYGGEGRGKTTLAAKFPKPLFMLLERGLPRGVTVDAVEEVDDPRVPTYPMYAPRLHNRARALVMDACDIIGFLSEDLRVVTDDGGFRERVRATAGNGRFLFVEGRPAFAAKNRYGMAEKI